MLTPAFELKQEGGFLHIYIIAPLTKVSSTDIFVENTDFRFYSKPYYLRLSLPGEVVSDDRASASFDCDSNKYHIKLPKVNEDEHFEGLDMITRLLAPKGHEHLEQSGVQVAVDEANSQADEDIDWENFDWQIYQEPFHEAQTTGASPTYGFANRRGGELKRLKSELLEVFDITDPDDIPVEQRSDLRMTQEMQDFNIDHYLGDKCEVENEESMISITDTLTYTPPWELLCKQYKQGGELEDIVTLTEEEMSTMRQLPRKEYLIDKQCCLSCCLSLIDLLFAYAYDYRFTEGEGNVESGHNIRKLSATLSWLEVPQSLEAVMITSYRRSLIYPYFRHWKLTQTVMADVQNILALGKRQVLRCFLDIRQHFTRTEMYYILNELYMDDYCVWLQSLKDMQLQSLATQMSKITIDKESVGLDLVRCELMAQVYAEADDNDSSSSSADAVDMLTKCIGTVQLVSSDDSDDDDSEKNGCSSDSDSCDSDCKSCDSDSTDGDSYESSCNEDNTDSSSCMKSENDRDRDNVDVVGSSEAAPEPSVNDKHGENVVTATNTVAAEDTSSEQ